MARGYDDELECGGGAWKGISVRGGELGMGRSGFSVYDWVKGWELYRQVLR